MSILIYYMRNRDNIIKNLNRYRKLLYWCYIHYQNIINLGVRIFFSFLCICTYFFFRCCWSTNIYNNPLHRGKNGSSKKLVILIVHNSYIFFCKKILNVLAWREHKIKNIIHQAISYRMTEFIGLSEVFLHQGWEIKLW